MKSQFQSTGDHETSKSERNPHDESDDLVGYLSRGNIVVENYIVDEDRPGDERVMYRSSPEFEAVMHRPQDLLYTEHKPVSHSVQMQGYNK
jgi:hypothetical protein